MRRVIASALVLIAAAAFLIVAGGASSGSTNPDGTYTIELDNAFGLVTGADFKVAGVRAGSIKSIDLDQKTLHALVKVQVTQPGFGQFHQDATCDSRPQSLIGEYFVECSPGNSGPVLKAGSVIPVTQTSTTIAPDLLNDIMRMPVRQRFTLIINELGAGVAGRSGDLQAALRRAVPALTETDNLLKLLADDSGTLQSLTVNSDSVVTALANNSAQVQRFIVEANSAATHTANQDVALRATFQLLPGFLEQLQPAMKDLGQAAVANTPVLQNLNSASGNLAALLTDLVPFANSSRIALKSLGQAAVTGTQAVTAAGPTVAHLNTFAATTPELSQNLAIVLHDLNDRSRAVETDPRSPGGKGYTGLEALLQYVFNQAMAINGFSQFGHLLTVDAFVDPQCSPYATPGTVALSLKKYGSQFRHCYAWLGPNQPGVNEPDPTNPGGPVPDPGGAPPGDSGPSTSATRLTAADVVASAAASTKTATTANTSSTPSTAAAKRSAAAGPPISLNKTIGSLLGMFGGSGGSGSGGSTGTTSTTTTTTSTSSAPSSGTSTTGQTQQLLNYLLSP
jgi:virulence factor Mce-like protein